jgi:hypothetical protein
MRKYLKVPYSEKEEAKKLGARWSPFHKSWYVEGIPDIIPFIKWMDTRMQNHLMKPHKR